MTLDTFFKKFDTFADAPNAVAKMRELVLELAVKGKIVKQNDAEGSGADLIKIAASKREKLIREKRLKEPRSIKPVAEFDRPQIPPNWKWTNLSELAQIAPRNDAPDSTIATFLPMPAIPQQYGGELRGEIRPWSEIKNGFTHLADGDIALGKITPCFQNGKSAVIENLENGIGAGTTELHIARPFAPVVDPHYVWIFLRSPRFLLEGIPHMTGSAGQKRVPTSYFALKPFPLPPLAEQKRIVAKVDELMALCDRLEAQQQERETRHAALARASLARFAEAPTPANLNLLFHKSYTIPPADLRKSILTLAGQGKLVPQDPDDEPAESILDATRLLFEQLAKAKKISSPKPLPPIAREDKMLFSLPSGWAWCRLGHIMRISSGNGLVAKDMNEGPIPVYGGNGVTGYHDADNVSKPTLVIGRVGFYCGSIHVTPDKAWITDNAFITTFDERHIAMDFLSWLLKATNLRERDNATAQPVISGGKVYPTLLALPPLAEQRRIVAKVDELMALVDALETQLATARTSASQLLEAAVADLSSIQ